MTASISQSALQWLDRLLGQAHGTLLEVLSPGSVETCTVMEGKNVVVNERGAGKLAHADEACPEPAGAARNGLSGCMAFTQPGLPTTCGRRARHVRQSGHFHPLPGIFEPGARRGRRHQAGWRRAAMPSVEARQERSASR